MILDLVKEYGMPAIVLLQAAICSMLGKIAFNDLPHINTRLARLEGRQEERDKAKR